ncbi:MAG: replicative DNA helicase [Paludibacteraceae bacterium]|nr:replicative DNA helicase [Paludibacteraceae bacterium]
MPSSVRSNSRRSKQEYEPIGPNEAGKLPPQAIELEETTLGALMIENGAYDRVCQFLKAEYFYMPAHQKIFAAIAQLAGHEQPVDMYTVVEQLRKSEDLESVGGMPYIASLTTKVISAAHLEYHGRIISQKYVERELIRIAGKISEHAFDETTDVDDQLQQAQAALFELNQHSQMRDFNRIDSVVQEALERMRAAGQKDGATGIRSGYIDLDNITSGWQRSDLIIIAARPAMGKTAFVLSMAKNIAVDSNVPVAIFSLEMSNVQLANRLIMNVCELDGSKLKSGQISQDDWKQIDTNIQRLSDAPIYIDDTPSLSVAELRSKSRRLVSEHGVQLIIIDYLQLMNASGMNVGSREQEVSTISRSLKALAKELDIPVIALSQLNRSVESRNNDGKRPQLSDLRESGAIEQDADMVCFIHRPEYYKMYDDGNGNSTIGKAEIIIAKHRNGAVDTVTLRFKGQYAKFANLDDADMAADGRMQQAIKIQSKINETPLPEYNDNLPMSGGMPYVGAMPAPETDATPF